MTFRLWIETLSKERMKKWITEPVQPGWVILAGLIWAGLVYINFYPNREQKDENHIFVHQRVPDAVSIRQVAAGNQPGILLAMLGIGLDQELEDATELFDKLRSHTEIPIEAAPSWGLLFHLLQEPQLAARSLSIDPGENIDVSNQLATVRAFIHQTETSPEIEKWIYDRYNDGACSIPEYFYLARIKEDETVRLWLNRTSEKMILRILGADLIFYSFAIASLLSLIWVVRLRKRATGIARCRIHQSWALSRILLEFFIAEIISCCVLLLLQPFYQYAYSETFFFSSISLQVIPAAWLVLRLHPSLSIAMKTFRISGPKRTTFPSAAAGLTGFAVLLLGGWLVVPFDTKSKFLTDSIAPYLLDYLPSISTTMFLAVILAPIFEEIVFRGFLFGGLRYKIGDFFGATLSSFIFAAVHGYSPMGFVSVVISGLIFCGLYRWSGSLIPGMIAHAAFNLVLTTGTVASYSFH